MAHASAAFGIVPEFITETGERVIIGAEIHVPHPLLAVEARIAGLDPLGVGALDAIYHVGGNRLFREYLEVSLDWHTEVGEHLIEAKLLGLRL